MLSTATSRPKFLKLRVTGERLRERVGTSLERQSLVYRPALQTTSRRPDVPKQGPEHSKVARVHEEASEHPECQRDGLDPQPWDCHQGTRQDRNAVDCAQRDSITLLVQQPGDHGNGKAGKGDDDSSEFGVRVALVALVLELETLRSQIQLSRFRDEMRE